MKEVITKIKLSITLLNEQSLKAKENDEIKRIIYLDGQIEAYTQCLIILQEAKMEDLTKQEAIDAMLIGKKVTHKSFNSVEYLYMNEAKEIMAKYINEGESDHSFDIDIFGYNNDFEIYKQKVLA